MRRVKPIKIIYKYIGDNNPEEKIKSEKILEEVYDRLFEKVFSELREKRKKTSYLEK